MHQIWSDRFFQSDPIVPTLHILNISVAVFFEIRNFKAEIDVSGRLKTNAKINLHRYILNMFFGVLCTKFNELWSRLNSTVPAKYNMINILHYFTKKTSGMFGIVFCLRHTRSEAYTYVSTKIKHPNQNLEVYLTFWISSIYFF